MMRARRRLAATQLLDDDSLAAKPPPTARAAAPGHGSALEDEIDRNLSAAVEGVSLAGAAPSGGTPGGGCRNAERSAASPEKLPEGRRHDGPEQAAAAGGGWECAMVWLLQCPDERGVFREILRFLCVRLTLYRIFSFLLLFVPG